MRLKMVVILLAMFFCGMGCSNANNVYTDKQGLIQFSMPAGWSLKSDSNGMRFVRSEKPQEKTVLVIDVKAQDPHRTLEDQLEISRKVIRQQNAELITDQEFGRKGFSAWEQVFRLPHAAKITKHTIFLYSDEARVEVYVIANADVYPDYVDDLNYVVKTLRRE